MPSAPTGYDATGQLTEVHMGVTTGNPAGLSQQTYSYNTLGDVISTSDGSGNGTNFLYDARGNLMLKVDGEGNTVTSTYDTNNQLLTQTSSGNDGQQLTNRFIYDASGDNLLRFSVFPKGRVTEYRYNSLGQRTSEIQYAAGTIDLTAFAAGATPGVALMQTWVGTEPGPKPAHRLQLRFPRPAQQFHYLRYGRLLGQRSPGPDDALRLQRGRRALQTVRPNSASTTQYVYDGLGRVILATAPSSDGTTANTSTTQYADTQSKTTVTSANGLTTISVYDAAGQLVSTSQASGGATLGTTTYTYDAAGRLVSTPDPTGVRQWMVHDAAGRKVAAVDSTGTAAEFVYDGNGQLAETILYAQQLGTVSTAPTLDNIHALASAGDRKSWNLYDAAHRLRYQIDAQGVVIDAEWGQSNNGDFTVYTGNTDMAGQTAATLDAQPGVGRSVQTGEVEMPPSPA